MPPKLDLTGHKYGRLTVVEPAPNAGTASRWLCRCDCGSQVVVRLGNLRKGNTRSCGCIRAEVAADRATTHGLSGTPIHNVWRGMIGRCTQPGHKNYDLYGGRGISVCDRWMDLENFYEDMGDPPANKTLDRIDNDGDYEPSNCRWATQKQQVRNSRTATHLTFRGRTKSMVGWAEETGIAAYNISARLQRGWTVEKALSTPVGT